jgi:glycosyltransferase involved in cell wall biosynthesis
MNATAEWIVGGCYVILGLGAWVVLAVGMIKGHKRMSLLARPGFPLPEPAPTASVLVPVKDEAHQIRSCVESILQLDYPNLQILIIDDRSSDGTEQVLGELARVHAQQLEVIRVREGELPPGWSGKCHALHVSSQRADAQWLLFVDSDVIVAPDALRIAIALAEWKRYDLVSLLPRVEARSFWERLIIPLCGAASAAMYLLPMTNYNELPGVAFANGQFMLVRRSAYDAIGGHATVRHTLSEDVAIARLLKRRGLRPRLAIGSDFASTRMYSSLGAILQGWSRNFFSGSLGRPWRILAAILFVLVSCYSCYAALAWGMYRNVNPSAQIGGWGWIAAALAHGSVMTVALAQSYRWSGNPRRYALLFPIGAAALLLIWMRALRMTFGGKVEWRGTSYDYRVGRGIVAPFPCTRGEGGGRGNIEHAARARTGDRSGDARSTYPLPNPLPEYRERE